MLDMSRAVSLLVLVSLAACGGEEASPSDTEPEVDCFALGESGTYAIDRRFDFEDGASMQQLAAECEEAGCISRETAICIFEQARARSGYGGGDPGAHVIRVHANDDPPVLAWEVWSELPAEDRVTGYSEYVCTLHAMDGTEMRCGGRAPPVVL